MTGLLLFAIRAVHTAAFFVIAGSILVVLFDGLRRRPRRRTAVASTIALAECAVFAANGFVCPLTPLAERYGAKRGSVTDIFLPDVIARNLTWIATPILVVGLALNARAFLGRRRGEASGPAMPSARSGHDVSGPNRRAEPGPRRTHGRPPGRNCRRSPRWR